MPLPRLQCSYSCSPAADQAIRAVLAPDQAAARIREVRYRELAALDGLID